MSRVNVSLCRVNPFRVRVVFMSGVEVVFVWEKKIRHGANTTQTRHVTRIATLRYVPLVAFNYISEYNEDLMSSNIMACIFFFLFEVLEKAQI